MIGMIAPGRRAAADAAAGRCRRISRTDRARRAHGRRVRVVVGQRGDVAHGDLLGRGLLGLVTRGLLALRLPALSGSLIALRRSLLFLPLCLLRLGLLLLLQTRGDAVHHRAVGGAGSRGLEDLDTLLSHRHGTDGLSIGHGLLSLLGVVVLGDLEGAGGALLERIGDLLDGRGGTGDRQRQVLRAGVQGR